MTPHLHVQSLQVDLVGNRAARAKLLDMLVERECFRSHGVRLLLILYILILLVRFDERSTSVRRAFDERSTILVLSPLFQLADGTFCVRRAFDHPLLFK